MKLDEHDFKTKDPSGRKNVLLLGTWPTAGGAVGKGWTLAEDAASILNAALAGDHELVELGQDAKTVAELRQIYARAMNEVKCSPVDLVVVGKLPKMFRDTDAMLKLVFACQDLEVRLIVPAMGIDTATQPGPLPPCVSGLTAEMHLSAIKRSLKKPA